MNEFNFKSYGNSNQTISYCEVDKCKAVVDLQQQLDQLKAENDELKESQNVEIKENKILREQLKRKEQECERLKDKIIDMNSVVEDAVVNLGNRELTLYDIPFEIHKLTKQLDQLKAENEILKQYKASKQASYERMQREWNNAVNENRELKAENGELKEYFKIAKEASNCNLKALGEMTEWADKLDEENDQLKAENETYKKMLDNSEVRVALTDIRTGEREIWRNLGMKADKYKQTLTEIKEIAEKMKKLSEEDGGELTECFFRDKQCEKCSEDKCLPYWFEQILQKISECEGNDE